MFKIAGGIIIINLFFVDITNSLQVPYFLKVSIYLS